MNNESTGTNAAMMLQDINKREQQAHEQVVQLSAVHDSIQKDLDSLLAQAKKKYGTDDVAQLNSILLQMEEEESKRLSSQANTLNKAETEIKKILASLDISHAGISLNLEFLSEGASLADRIERTREIVMRLQAEHGATLSQLASKEQDSEKRYGTSDIDQLRLLYSQRKTKNDQILKANTEALEAIEVTINDIQQKANQYGCSNFT